MRTGLFDPSRRPDVLTFQAARDVLPPGLSAAITRESRLAALPGLRQRGHTRGRWRYLLPYMPRYFSHLDLAEYDLVIASSHACAINARPRPDAVYVCYVHTPIRYVWMPELERERLRGAKGVALRLLSARLRRLDRAAARRPDGLVANSSAVRERIRRFYGRDAEVVPPPVEVDRLDPGREKEPGHFLWVHRLVDYKRPELVAEAFRGLPYRLTMVGIGPLEARLRSTLPSNVELRGWIPQAELDELLERASGFIHVAEEDFGMTMVEALAAGTPVIALNRGGAKDIVRPMIDGLLLDEPTVPALRRAIEGVASGSWERSQLVARASEFSRQQFLRQMSAYIRRLLDDSGGLAAAPARG
jgi:glycosyltransferase involved in cell wall biosynthesis